MIVIGCNNVMQEVCRAITQEPLGGAPPLNLSPRMTNFGPGSQTVPKPCRKRGKLEEAARSKKELDKVKDTAGICRAGRQGHFKAFRFILMTVGKP